MQEGRTCERSKHHAPLSPDHCWSSEAIPWLWDWEIGESMINYLHQVEILVFVAASRNADLALNLEAGEALSKMVFAMCTKIY